MLILQSTPNWLAPKTALVVLVVAVVVGWACHRLAAAKGLRRFRAALRSLQLGAASVVVVEGTFALSYALTDDWLLLGIGLLGAFVALNFSWLRNVMAGIALALEGRFHHGDTVSLGSWTGRIERFDLRAVRIRSMDGRHHTVPNTEFLERTVTSLSGGGDSACDLEIPLPAGIPADRARELARQAAAMTPLASPRHEPEVFIKTAIGAETSAGTGLGTRIHIRGYACQPAFRDHYRGDVIFRLMRTFESESSAGRLTD